jgi:hypothetical protein
LIIDSHQLFWIAGPGDCHWMDPKAVPVLCGDCLRLDIEGTDRLFGANAARFYGLGERR